MDEITVFRCWDEPMADMAVGLLKAEGLHAHKLADIVRSVHPFTFDGLGEIEVRVPEDEAESAKEIIGARFSESEFFPDENESDGE
ncbi:MAG: hypothetical protein JXB48_18915 [Candidatus Latescibacteria bacterium]|nr:hypothetical protein [Candidatus Latescibacterota bacterium]